MGQAGLDVLGRGSFGYISLSQPTCAPSGRKAEDLGSAFTTVRVQSGATVLVSGAVMGKAQWWQEQGAPSDPTPAGSRWGRRSEGPSPGRRGMGGQTGSQIHDRTAR